PGERGGRLLLLDRTGRVRLIGQAGWTGRVSGGLPARAVEGRLYVLVSEEGGFRIERWRVTRGWKVVGR
ncbi:MAG: hypothetical protein IRY95_01410, partial [Clostridia bacterium]|nr:hypothetical protein [Clostridia bacterium]